MQTFKSESKAFKAGCDHVAALCKDKLPNWGLRVLANTKDASDRATSYKVLIVPERGLGFTPYYL